MYSRRKLYPDQNQQSLNTSPEPISVENTEGKTDPTCDSSPIQHVDIVDRPVGLRKKIQSCSYILYVVSLDHLSSAYQAFMTRLDHVQIPLSIEIALQDPKWKADASEEIQAIEKNNTSIVIQLPQETDICM